MSTLRVDNIKSRTGTVVTIPDAQTLAVTGVSSISGNQTVGGTQTVSGWQTVSGSQIVSGNTNITGIGTVGGTLNVSGDLNVSGGGSVVATTGVADDTDTLVKPDVGAAATNAGLAASLATTPITAASPYYY